MYIPPKNKQENNSCNTIWFITFVILPFVVYGAIILFVPMPSCAGYTNSMLNVTYDRYNISEFNITKAHNPRRHRYSYFRFESNLQNLKDIISNSNYRLKFTESSFCGGSCVKDISTYRYIIEDDTKSYIIDYHLDSLKNDDYMIALKNKNYKTDYNFGSPKSVKMFFLSDK